MTLPQYFLVLLVCASSLACAPKPATPGGDSQPVTETPATPDGDSQPVTDTPETPDTSEMFACASDDQCVVLEMGCCDHCNGGWRLSVNTAHAEAATAQHHDEHCSGGCTKRGCEWNTKAVCHEGTCAMTEDRNLSGAPTLYENELR